MLKRFLLSLWPILRQKISHNMLLINICVFIIKSKQIRRISSIPETRFRMLMLFTRQPTQFREMPLWNWSRAGTAPPPHRICQANFCFQLISFNKLRGGGGSAFIPFKVRGHSFSRRLFVWFIWRNDRIASLSEWYQTKLRTFGSVSPFFFKSTFGVPL